MSECPPTTPKALLNFKKTATPQAETKSGKKLVAFCLGAILLIALLLRTAGMWRGAHDETPFHPDVSKQVRALEQYMDGHYVFYTHNRFRDGYPLFLAHMDEWILRPSYALYKAIAEWTSPDISPLPPVPSYPDLHKITRLLRVLYGMIIVILAYPVARRFGLKRPAALSATAIVALSPLAVTVAHFSSGDIGCDLFLALVVASISRHVYRPKQKWIFLSGVMCAFAFAAKYNGILSAFILALYVTRLHLRKGGSFKTFCRTAAWSVGGFILGLVIAIPQLLSDTKRTVGLIVKMLKFIKIYAVPSELKELPWTEQTVYSFQHNGPDLWRSLGWLTLLVALAALIPALLACRRALTNEHSRRLRALHLSVASFVPLALFVGLAGKPISQPFHFSFLVFPIALVTLFSLSAASQHLKTSGRLIALLLAAICLFEQMTPSVSDNLYWRLDDVETVTKQMLRDPPITGLRQRKHCRVQRPEVIVRSFVVEKDPVSHFRNRSRALITPDGPAWNQIGILPVPQVSARQSNPWVFMEGPSFPRNDRALPLRSGRPANYYLVATESKTVETKALLQAGSRPVKIEINFGGTHTTDLLAPNQSKWCSLKDTHPRTREIDEHLGDQKARIAEMEAVATGGNAWILLAHTPREVEVLDAFHLAQPQPLSIRVKTMNKAKCADLFSRARYLGEEGACISLEQGSRKRSTSALNLGHQTGLAAGPYILSMQVISHQDKGKVDVQLIGPSARSCVMQQTRKLTKGLNLINIPFEKQLAPYVCRLKLRALTGRFDVIRWSIRPDIDRIVQKLTAAPAGDTPMWMLPRQRVAQTRKRPMGRIGNLEVIDINMPETAKAGTALEGTITLRLIDVTEATKEQEIFFHFEDANHHHCHSAHINDDDSQFEGGDVRNFRIELPETLQPGHYRIDLGLWNKRTERRVKVKQTAENITSHRDKLKAVTTLLIQ